MLTLFPTIDFTNTLLYAKPPPAVSEPIQPNLIKILKNKL